MRRIKCFALLLPLLVASAGLVAADKEVPSGFTSLFNGQDFAGWKVPEGDNGHWKIVDGVIDYDARSESKGDKCLWTDKSFGDFVLRMDWRLKLRLVSRRTFCPLPRRLRSVTPIPRRRPNSELRRR